MSDNNGNNFKFKTVEDIAKLHAAVVILTERISTNITGLQNDVKTLSEQVGNIKQPCNILERHINDHKSSSIVEWIRKKPIQATLIGLFIISQLGISLDRLVEILTELIK
ncbi:MAG: hypothetical protein ACFE95_02785 [Candidatus Hodarchaeota archaeon]